MNNRDPSTALQEDLHVLCQGKETESAGGGSLGQRCFRTRDYFTTQALLRVALSTKPMNTADFEMIRRGGLA